jgi:phage FluMu protein Com
VIMELTVTLDFACCGCDAPVRVTVHCAGKGLAGDQAQTVAAVTIPCPECGQINQVFFQPTGQVHSVKPYFSPRPLPVPSIN